MLKNVLFNYITKMQTKTETKNVQKRHFEGLIATRDLSIFAS